MHYVQSSCIIYLNEVSTYKNNTENLKTIPVRFIIWGDTSAQVETQIIYNQTGISFAAPLFYMYPKRRHVAGID